MDTDNNKSMESVESTTDDGEPIVQLSEYNARESIGVPMFKVYLSLFVLTNALTLDQLQYKTKRNKRQRVVDNENDQENQLPRPNC